MTNGTYDAANRLNQWTVPGGGVSPSYDANGNLLNDGTRSFTWDARNRLTGIAGVASFSYDALGRRQSATINGNTVSYLYDGTDPVQEQAGGTALANILTGLGIDERFMRTEGTNGSIYLTDALGSPVALTDSTGAIKTSYGYDPYGNTSAIGTASDNKYQYAGRENDGTGLYFNRARYYSPAWGRFIAEDPIGLNGGINRFAYAGGNPISFRDPTGNFLAPSPVITTPGLVLGPVGAGIGVIIGTLTPSSTATDDTVSGTAKCKNGKCPPCDPPVGSIRYRFDQVPPSKPHFPFPGDHYNLYQMNQNPNNCQCFYKPIGASETPPPGSEPF